ncbi:hypothetical protein O181_056114 [Austropuccinia psidii MF-1]|uniref:Uncharacterized protein n=1 Tax=Austropuccinia psidii MF-1 TaxID=1389203 RepID=A0A9Q3HVB3_9BASI|nr:hypothetical protein [Austropuccinia psidii MF-1]
MESIETEEEDEDEDDKEPVSDDGRNQSSLSSFYLTCQNPPNIGPTPPESNSGIKKCERKTKYGRTVIVSRRETSQEKPHQSHLQHKEIDLDYPKFPCIVSFNQPSNNSYSKSHDQDHHLTISNPSHDHQSINFIHQSRIDSPQLSCKTSNWAINTKQSANKSDKENHPGLAITFGKSVTNFPSSISPVPHHHFQPPSETSLVLDDDSSFNPLPNKTQQTHGTENEITYKTSKIAQDQPIKES